VNAKPYYNHIYEEVNKLNLPLYIFIVGDQPTWKDQNHSFRKNKQLQIPSVPSFGYFNGKKLVNRLGG
jgi:predicted component of type VI protein secretion system